ncbi:MAG: hypothetical protein BWY85_02318 [Firmicutes bacterium ADurb.Bin506]|nr:MAG: hypothetical protein BWY85_02318 [Firmicutes bacterium ADurb.Bin506]
MAKGPFHIGRGFHGHSTENECPCPQEDCGLIHEERVDPECTQHPFKHAKTIRQMHRASECFVCGVTAILDEYLTDPDWSWRDPDWDVSKHSLTQTTALLVMAVYLRERYPVVRPS